jgi:hypothetical protein
MRVVTNGQKNSDHRTLLAVMIVPADDFPAASRDRAHALFGL